MRIAVIIMWAALSLANGQTQNLEEQRQWERLRMEMWLREARNPKPKPPDGIVEMSGFIERYAEFLVKLDKFTRELFGCGDKAKDVSECKPETGRFDVRSWNSLRKEAKGLFK